MNERFVQACKGALAGAVVGLLVWLSSGCWFCYFPGDLIAGISLFFAVASALVGREFREEFNEMFWGGLSHWF
jgi:hypothetical protein